MDKRQQTIDVIKATYAYQNKEIDDASLIKIVCKYYDFIKQENLSQADLQFLKKIANMVGIPHYFEHLNNFQDVKLKEHSLTTLSAEIYESTLHTDESTIVHQYQKDILSHFQQDKLNRYFLSASTSFGKTFLAYEVFKKMKYKNVVLIFPTIALLCENLERVHKNETYRDYQVHTLSEVPLEDFGEKNIYIYTPERFLSFLEKQKTRPELDFIFIDEVYKIDNEYIIDDDEKKEHERDVSYRLAAYYSVIGNADILLAGPYIEKYSHSFESFLANNEIIKLDYNKYEIVGKTEGSVKGAQKLLVDSELTLQFEEGENSKKKRLRRTVKTLCLDKKENCIIYCAAPHLAESYAKELPTLIEPKDIKSDYQNFIAHVSEQYGDDWVVTQCLKNGIGIHHGLVPKYIQKEIINYFNLGVLKAITSTTTITEGVNTSAKNLIVTLNKKGRKELKRFDAKNIAGRAGRFEKHYSGRIISIQNPFLEDLKKEKEEIKHKNYDLDAPKDEIDLFYSADDFLSEDDKRKRDEIIQDQHERNIPDYILDMFKVVSKSDKIKLYDTILKFTPAQHQAIRTLISRINASDEVNIDWNGFEEFQKAVLPILRESQLKGFSEQEILTKNGTFSLLTIITDSYLKGGFGGLVSYKCRIQGKSTDVATREAARFVYNIAKYQLVKYLGVFNIMYKFYRSAIENIEFEDVSGLDRLLTKLEYNALTSVGRKISDYGVPEKVLKYYEEDKNPIIFAKFDEYEKTFQNKIKYIISDEKER